MPSNKRRYYWLFSGEVVFTADGETIAKQNMNSIITSDNKFINRQDMNQGQQAAFQRFHREFLNGADLPPTFKLIDVFILGLTPLGHMTMAEFHAGYPEANQTNEPLGDAQEYQRTIAGLN